MHECMFDPFDNVVDSRAARGLGWAVFDHFDQTEIKPNYQFCKKIKPRPTQQWWKTEWSVYVISVRFCLFLGVVKRKEKNGEMEAQDQQMLGFFKSTNPKKYEP